MTIVWFAKKCTLYTEKIQSEINNSRQLFVPPFVVGTLMYLQFKVKNYRRKSIYYKKID